MKATHIKKEDVDPEKQPVGPADVVELVMVADPVDAEHHEADRVAEQLRSERCQVADSQAVGDVRDVDLEHHQGHRDGEHAVGQGLDAFGLEAALGRLAGGADGSNASLREPRSQFRG